MSLLSRNNQINKLNKNNINIKTYFRDNTQHVIDSGNYSIDNLVNAVINKKEYYKNNKLIKRMYGYDSRIEYTSINTIQNSYTCPNCMMNVILDNTSHECPMCGSELLINYKNKELGSIYTYDGIIHNRNYVILTCILDIIMACVSGITYFYGTAKTYNIVDIRSTIGVGLLGALIFFFLFYLAGALLFVVPMRIKRNKIVKSDSKVWETLDKRGISFNTFYNNLFYELKNYYFVDHDTAIIDFDIIDYFNFKVLEDGSNLYVSFDAVIREVKYSNNKFRFEQYNKRITLKKNNKTVTKNKKNDLSKVHCHNCGNELDINDNKCSSCGVKNNYNQEWYLNK